MFYQPANDPLLKKIRACTLCHDVLPFEPKPVLNFTKGAKILIVGQAPGSKVHATGIPWNDPSGDRLRDWLGVDKEVFYNPKIIVIAPMGFCYPGKGISGDLPPRPECSQQWMHQILARLENLQLKIIIGTYAQSYFLKDSQLDLTTIVRRWREFAPHVFPLPHPSPRNNIWLKKNPWFEREVVPQLRRQTRKVLFPRAS